MIVIQSDEYVVESCELFEAVSNDCRSRAFILVIYPEWVEYETIIKGIICHLNCDYYISPLHDKDVDEDGKPLKPHNHVLLTFKYPITKSSLIRQLSFQYDNLCGKCVNVNSFIRYLCHFGWDEKCQYDKGDIKTNQVVKVNAAFNYSISDIDALMAIDDYLSLNPTIRPLSLTIWAEQNGYATVLRKYHSFINNQLNFNRRK